MYSDFNLSLSDYEDLLGEVVPLQEADFVEADKISQRLTLNQPTGRQSWQIYLHYLALCGFKQWFGQRTTPHPLNTEEAFILLPEPANIHHRGQTAVCRLQAQSFKICLISTDGSAEDWEIPATAVQKPELAAHFYVPIVIHEESGQAEILGFMRHDQIPASSLEQHSYRLSIDAINPELDTLLLYLSSIDTDAIPLPASATPSSQTIRQLLIQPAVNTGQWLLQQATNVIDEIAETIAWQILPPMELAPATRGGDGTDVSSPIGTLSAILMNLMRSGITIPSNHGAAYQNFILGELSLRLYIVISPADSTSDGSTQEWSLLTIIQQQNGHNLPHGVGLKIQDDSTLLVDRQTETSSSAYIYGRVIGEPHEAFMITMSYQNYVLTLPPIGFDLMEDVEVNP